MTHEEKIDHAKQLIYAQRSQPCVLYWSGGKDSTVLLHLIREVMPLNRLSCHAYPIALVYHRQPWFPHKNEFADHVIRSWGLEVYDFQPYAAGIKCKDDRLELAAEYPFGTGRMHMPLNTEAPVPRRPFVCGRLWLERPKSALFKYPWSVAFIGHKSSDIDPYEGNVPLKSDTVEDDECGVKIVFPLRHWTDDDVWDYTENNNLPYDKRRYKDRQSTSNTWDNPDHIHACTACIDPRNPEPLVFCPKLREPVANIGHRVLRIEELPQYIGKEQETV